MAVLTSRRGPTLGSRYCHEPSFEWAATLDELPVLAQEEAQHDPGEEDDAEGDDAAGEVALFEKSQGQHGVRRSLFYDDKGDKCRCGDRECEQDPGRRPARLTALDDSVDEGRHCEGCGDCARDVEADVAVVAGLSNEEHSQASERKDRDVDPDCGGVVPVFDEVAAHCWAEPDAKSANGGPDCDCLRSFVAFEDVRDDGQGGRKHKRRAESLRSTGGDERPDCVGESAEHGSRGEDRKADAHPALAAVAVADRPSEKKEPGEDQDVGVDYPLELAG